MAAPNLIFHWPLSSAGLKLAAAANLSAGAVWSEAASSSPGSNTMFTLTLPPNGTRF
ncbi:MAG: hypothetical protein ABSG04_03300 [Verrucomicrobiota bacterium]